MSYVKYPRLMFIRKRCKRLQLQFGSFLDRPDCRMAADFTPDTRSSSRHSLRMGAANLGLQGTVQEQLAHAAG